MKKENIILSSILLLATIILTLSLISSANDTPITTTPANLNIDDLQKFADDPSQIATSSKDYLKQEQGKLREKIINDNPYLKRIFDAYDKISPYTNPALKIVLGIEPQLTWLFLLTFIIWITLVTNIYSILSVFSTFSKGASIVMALLMVIIVSVLGIPKWIAGKLISAIGLLGTWWVQLIAIVLLIILLILISVFRKQWEQIRNSWMDRREKMKMLDELAELKLKGRSTAAMEKALRGF